MRFYSELLQRAGLISQIRQISFLILASSVSIGLLGFVLSGVWGLGLCISLLGLAIAVEILRLRGEARQRGGRRQLGQRFENVGTHFGRADFLFTGVAGLFHGGARIREMNGRLYSLTVDSDQITLCVTGLR